jgi:hypothetical protein
MKNQTIINWILGLCVCTSLLLSIQTQNRTIKDLEESNKRTLFGNMATIKNGEYVLTEMSWEDMSTLTTMGLLKPVEDEEDVLKSINEVRIMEMGLLYPVICVLKKPTMGPPESFHWLIRDGWFKWELLDGDEFLQSPHSRRLKERFAVCSLK